MSGPAMRALTPADAEGAAALLRALLGDTRHELRALELLSNALLARDGDRAFGAIDDEDGAMRGVVLLGVVAGADRVAKVHFIASRERAHHAPLTEWIVRTLAREGARMAIAEVPRESLFDEMDAALRARGFVEEGRVADWFDDGVALRLLVARAPFGVTPGA